MARPLNTGPVSTFGFLTSVLATVPSDGFQPAMVPSSVAKRKKSPLNSPAPLPLLLLKTVPVGVPLVPDAVPVAGGIVTVNGTFEPSPR